MDKLLTITDPCIEGQTQSAIKQRKRRLETYATISSTKELTRLEVMKQLEEKRLKQKEAAEMLGVSETRLAGESTKTG